MCSRDCYKERPSQALLRNADVLILSVQLSNCVSIALRSVNYYTPPLLHNCTLLRTKLLSQQYSTPFQQLNNYDDLFRRDKNI